MMDKTQHLSIAGVFLLIIVFGVCCELQRSNPPEEITDPFDSLAVSYWAGDGEHKAVAIVDFKGAVNNPGTVVIGYRWDGEAKGEDMLHAIADLFEQSPDYNLYVNVTGWNQGGFGTGIYGMGWDNDGDNIILTEFSDPDTYTIDSGDCYEGGWITRGYWAYYVSDDGEIWEAPDYGVSGRTLDDGCWDGFCWAPAPDWTATPPDNIPES
jgi:hypothetical protein